jgi:hypothetical protein
MLAWPRRATTQSEPEPRVFQSPELPCCASSWKTWRRFGLLYLGRRGKRNDPTSQMVASIHWFGVHRLWPTPILGHNNSKKPPLGPIYISLVVVNLGGGVSRTGHVSFASRHPYIVATFAKCEIPFIFIVEGVRVARVGWLVYGRSLPMRTHLAGLCTFERASCGGT